MEQRVIPVSDAEGGAPYLTAGPNPQLFPAIGIDRAHNDPKAAAERLMRTANGDHANRFAASHRMSMQWYEMGDTLGRTFDIAVALELAKICRKVAKTPAQQNLARHAFARASARLGERIGSSRHLRQAVHSYKASLKNMPRDGAVRRRAMTLNLLGNALAILGQFDVKNDLLTKAIATYREADAFWDPQLHAFDWAQTKGNLANALQYLGERQQAPALLYEAILAHEAALVIWTTNTLPQQRAMTLLNLANALRTLARLAGDPTLAARAIDVCQQVFEIWTYEDAPTKWASAQSTRGAALCQYGTLADCTDTLKKAALACQAALGEGSGTYVAHQMASTHFNLALIALALWEREGVTDQLVAADRHARTAHTAFAKSAAEYDRNQTVRLMAHIDGLLAQFAG